MIVYLLMGLQIIALVGFGCRRLLRYLRYMQQDEYSIERFLGWFLRTRSFDRRATFTVIGALCLTMVGFQNLALWVSGTCLLVMAIFEENPCRIGKLRLNLTARAKRILGASFFVYVTLLSLSLYAFAQPITTWWFAIIGLVQAIPLCLCIGCFLLQWHEKKLQIGFQNEARKLLQEYQPFIIGITGSYGKTSTKHALGRILQGSLGPTFWPSKGVNTLMGTTREIREFLRPGHRLAVIEMGAYYVGSIRKLCALTPPQAAIITGIGLAHLERYKAQETIELAKSELVQALPKHGVLVCNGDNEGARRLAKQYKTERTYLYGFDASQPLDCHITQLKIMENGTRFKINWMGSVYDAYTPQYGSVNISNLAAAFTMAVSLGASPDYVIALMGSLESVKNRLEVRREGSVTYIHDAYNSNPDGFKAALEVLRDYPGNKRFLMTPGMIEFGHQQAVQNQQLAYLASSICSHVLIVGSTNYESLIKGLQEGGFLRENIIMCRHREDAFLKLRSLMQEGDIVLIENDLPDLYEPPQGF